MSMSYATWPESQIFVSERPITLNPLLSQGAILAVAIDGGILAICPAFQPSSSSYFTTPTDWPIRMAILSWPQSAQLTSLFSPCQFWFSVFGNVSHVPNKWLHIFKDITLTYSFANWVSRPQMRHEFHPGHDLRTPFVRWAVNTVITWIKLLVTLNRLSKRLHKIAKMCGTCWTQNPLFS